MMQIGSEVSSAWQHGVTAGETLEQAPSGAKTAKLFRQRIAQMTQSL